MTRPYIRIARISLGLSLGLTGCFNGGSHEPPPRLFEPVSGYVYQSAETQALQDDSFANPGMLWVDQGAALWSSPPPGSNASCASCHGDAAASMTGVAVRYPVYEPQLDALLNLEGRINQCRIQRQGLAVLPYESEALLALTAFVAHQSKGLAINAAVDGPAQRFFERGRAYFYQRRGQMNLACHHCHEYNVGNLLRGDRLSQGQATGYPIYRLDWQTMGSLHRRLRFCNIGVRAEPFDFGAAEYVNLELYLAWRAQGLPSEAPAVRR